MLVIGHVDENSFRYRAKTTASATLDAGVGVDREDELIRCAVSIHLTMVHHRHCRNGICHLICHSLAIDVMLMLWPRLGQLVYGSSGQLSALTSIRYFRRDLVQIAE